MSRLRGHARALLAGTALGGLTGCGLIVGFGDLTEPDSGTRPDSKADGRASTDGTVPGAPTDATTDLGADAPRRRDARQGDGATNLDASCDSSCTGGCVDLANDPLNCGACGTACDPSGASPLCANGSCSVVVLWSEDASQPETIAVDDANVYWTNFETPTVLRVSLDGGSPTTIATDQILTTAIAVDSTYVYWTSETGVLRAKKPANGSPTLFAAPRDGGGKPTDLALSDASVFWLTTSNLQTLPKAASGSESPTVLLPDAGSASELGLVLGGGRLYWIASVNSSLGVISAPLDGGATSVLLADATSPAGLTVDRNFVYVTTETGVVRVGLDGGPPRLLAPITMSVGRAPIAVDDTYVYWVAGASVICAPLAGLDGGAPLTLWGIDAGPFAGAPGALALNSTYVYFPFSNAIWRAKKPAP